MDWIVWGLLSGLVVVGFVVWRRTCRQRDGAVAELARVNDELAARVSGFDDVLREVTDVWVPRAVASRSVGGTEWDLPSMGEGRLDRRVRTLLETVVEYTNTEQHAAGSVVRAVASGVQVRVAELTAVLARTKRRYDDVPAVVDDLQELDHRAAQVYQTAQQAAMLSGAWPGQQRPPTPVEDVVRGAAGRIRDVARVRVQGMSSWAVGRRYVEPVLVALAAVLDNAATNSRPDLPVEVTVHPVPAGGVSIIIDDHGTGFTVEEAQRARYLLERVEAVDLRDLGDPPRMGWAVVGQIARRYGFWVWADLRAPYGGVRVVVRLPEHMLLAVPDTVVTMPPPPSPDTTREQTRHGLPKRARRSRHALKVNPPAAREDSVAVSEGVGSTGVSSRGRGDTAAVFAQFASATSIRERTGTGNGEHT